MVKRAAVITAAVGLALPGAAAATPRAATVMRGADFDRPVLASSPSHGVTVVARDKWTSSIRARHVSVGGSLGRVRTLDAGTDMNASGPSVAVDSSGTATAVWFDVGHALVARRITRDGRLGPLVTIAGETVETNVRFAAVGVDGAGNATVVWERAYIDFGYPHSPETIRASAFARRLNADGGLGPLLDLESGAGESTDPHVAVAASGRAIVAWRNYDLYGHYALRMATVEQDGTLVRAPDIFNSDQGGFGASALVAGERGDAIAVSSALGSVVGRVGLRPRVALGPTLGNGVASSAELAVDGSDVATAAWTVGYPYPHELSARRFGAGGAVGPPIGLYAGRDRVKGLSVAVDATGDATAAWTRISRTRSRRYAVAALGIGAHGRLGKLRTLAAPTRRFLSGPYLAADARGTVIVAWAERLSRSGPKSAIRLARRVKPKRP
jgi:hypothetical protein